MCTLSLEFGQNPSIAIKNVRWKRRHNVRGHVTSSRQVKMERLAGGDDGIFFISFIKEKNSWTDSWNNDNWQQRKASIILVNVVNWDVTRIKANYFAPFNGNTCQSQSPFVDILEILLWFCKNCDANRACDAEYNHRDVGSALLFARRLPRT